MISFSNYFQILEEDLQSSMNQAKNILMSNGFNEKDAIDGAENIKSIVMGSWSDLPPQQKRFNTDSNIPILAYLLLYVVTTTGSPYAALESGYAMYLNSPSATGHKLLPNSFNQLRDDIKNKVGHKPSPQKTQHIMQWSKELLNKLLQYSKQDDAKKNKTVGVPESDVVYKDDKLIVYLADTKEKAKKYGDEALCVSTKTGENYFWRYRAGNYVKGVGMSTYFIHWKNGNKILLDVLGYQDTAFGTYSYNKFDWDGVVNNNDIMTTDGKNQLPASLVLKEFPDLQEAFEKGVFKFIPYGKTEERIAEIERDVYNVMSLSNFEEISFFMELGKQVSESDWRYVESLFIPQQIKELLEKYSGLGGLLPQTMVSKYFNSMETRRYIHNMSKTPDRAFNYYRTLSARNEPIPEGLIEKIAEDPYYAYQYVSRFGSGDLPQVIIDGIATSGEYSYKYVHDQLGVAFDDIPKEFIDAILTSPKYSFHIIRNKFRGNAGDEPREFVDAMLRSPEYAYRYASVILRYLNVPDDVIKAFSEDPYSSYNYVTTVIDRGITPINDIPDILVKSIGKNPEYAHRYAIYYLKKNNIEIPEYFIKGIISDPMEAVSYLYDMEMFGEAPKEFVDSIITDASASYEYASSILSMNNVPEKVIDAISESPTHSGYYAELARRKNIEIPNSIFEGISKDDYISMNFMRTSRYLDIPQIIINGAAKTSENVYNILSNIPDVKLPEGAMEILAEQPYNAFYYVRDVLNFHNIPDVILKSIIKNPSYAYSYADRLSRRDEKIPDEVMDSIKTSGEYTTKFVTNILQHKNVSEELLDIVREYDPDVLVHYYCNLLKDGIQLSDSIIDFFAKSPQNSYLYAESILGSEMQLPSRILDSIKSSPYSMCKFAQLHYVNFDRSAPSEYDEIISKSQNASYEYINLLLRKGLPVMDELSKTVAEDIDFAISLVDDLLDSGVSITDIPESILISISDSPDTSLKVARLLGDENVPEIIIGGIAGSSRTARRFATRLLPNMDIPDIILNAIARDPSDSYSYADEILNHSGDVPGIIVNTIRKDKSYLYQYLKKLGGEVSDEYLEELAQDSKVALKYAMHLKSVNEPVPDIIYKGIAKEPDKAYDLVYYYPAEIPEVIINSIANSPNEYQPFYVAQIVMGRGEPIPDAITNAIAKHPQQSYDWATAYLKMVNVPDVIINSIAKKLNLSYDYAIELFPLQPQPPQQIINAISKDTTSSYLYACYLNDQDVPVPEVIINSIKSNPGTWQKYQAEIMKESFYKMPTKKPKSFNMMYERILTMRTS